MNKVYFIGSLPFSGRSPVGGGEVGNLRTVRMLESFGYEVKIVRRLRSSSEASKITRLLTYPWRFTWNIVNLFFILMFGNRKGNVVHISGFAGVTIFIESMQMGLAKMFGYKTIYELRGGGIVGFYENGSIWYKKQFRYLVKKADYVFSQGQENEYLLKSLNVTNIFYYPNCVLDGFYPKELKPKPLDKINLLFYGRIEAEKNPLMIVEIARLLQEKYNNITLTMIGNGQGEFLKGVRRSMEYSLLEGSFVLLPGFKHEDLPSILLDKHFYIFPSTQPREGQSNSVTECMAYGIVPIASPQGFNRSTIGDDKLIIDELKAESYARRIIEIIQANKYHHYSQMVYERFQKNFTQKVVFERTLKLYREILEKEDK